MSKQKANEKMKGRRANKKANLFVFFRRRFRSGGEENERQMANNVMQAMRVYAKVLDRFW